MNNGKDNIINCTRFEELLTDYLDRTLDSVTNAAVGGHALSCPLCHALLNDVKQSLQACKSISVPHMPMTLLEARVLSMTMPETAMSCAEFEEYLTDYMDGFIPATLFHRWERHAVLCGFCTDLPGMVVRSIAACYTYKMDELAVPDGLHHRILKATIGTTEVKAVTPSIAAAWAEWVRGLRFPLPIPQLAPVAMMLLTALLVFTSADGGLANVYQKGFELAEQTYQQSADAWNGNPNDLDHVIPRQEPANGTTYIDNEDKK